LGANRIRDFSALRAMVNLINLNLNGSSIKDLSFLKGLLQLESLSLENNQLEDLTPLKGLENLEALDLRNNRIKHIPDWLVRFGHRIVWRENYERHGTNFFGNPIESPPIEIVKRGKAAVLRYFDQIRNQGVDYIFEAKLTLVGEGSAGKTSLQTRLMDAKAPLPGADSRTRGIKINDWEFKKDANNRHIVHIWDFGGQDVYYPVHRFFLTENSIFVLLASTRQTHHNFDYWIPTIYQFGGKSPIILGQTCDQGNRVLWNDLGYYVGNAHFNIIKTQELPYQEINLLKKNEGLSKIKKTIVDQIKNMPHYGKGVPKPWVFLRTRLVRESGKESCITFERFSQLCNRSSPTGFPNLVDIHDCAKFLHSIGVILWYSDNEELSNWVVLQPEWAMNAVYKIIDDDDIQKRRGNILAKDFIRLWKDKCYEGKHSMLKKMLEVFKIAFPKKHTKGDYILPARLVSIPSTLKWPDKEPYLRLEYKFEFMPRGMVNQVSAELSRYIVSDKEVWNNAVNLRNESNTAECQIEEDFYNRKINIKAKGKDARGLTMIVMNALKDITENYRGVELEIFVPCTCSVCMSSPKPEAFSYEKLLKWSEGKDRITCNESGESLSIDEMLYNIGLPNPEKEKRRMARDKVIKIFLASSSELEEDRRSFEIFISRENAILKEKGVFIELNIWEDFIDAMSQTRLQDEYNQAVTDCDIFLSLFFTKVGKYTAEEFERAFVQFKKTGKPLIYTYFKDGTINRSKIRKPDIESKLAFEEKLKSLGHFPTVYQDINDLKYQFKKQLEKILPKL
jgi:internalin A